MASNAMTSALDSQNPTPLQCSPDERPPVSLSEVASAAIAEELETARQKWHSALLKIPFKLGPRRTAAVARMTDYKRWYEKLLGQPGGLPDQVLPMDALPHREIKKS